jgi:hypothetical protein
LTADVVYDVLPAPVPVLPQTGACSPTPPGREPGAGADGCCCCANHDQHIEREGGPSRVQVCGAGLATKPVATIRTLTTVPGIGDARARALALVGISSVERLAAVEPAIVADVLEGVSARTARRLIEDARRLVERPVVA